MSLTRVLKTTAATLSHLFEVDETPTDAAGAVTYAVKRLDGTAVQSGTATHGVTGLYTAVLLGANTLVLDTFTVDWSGTVAGAAVVARDYVEVVGGFQFSLSTARARRPALDVVKYPTAELARVRTNVEQECEQICDTTFVPRFCRVALSGDGKSGQLTLPHADLRAIRAITVDGVAYTAPQVAAVPFSDSGIVWSGAPSVWASPWPLGLRNVIIEYEHGMDAPPDDIADAGIIRLRSKLGQTDTSVPTRAISFTATEGGTYRLSTPGRDPLTGQQKTGIPEVDAAYGRWGSNGLGAFA